MNIFILHTDPRESAVQLVDIHTSKMVLESAQMLANCFSKEDLALASCPRTQKGTIRKYSYYNHPCSIWVRESRDNMRWLIEHAISMDKERCRRFNTSTPHFSISFIYWVKDSINISLVKEGTLTKFAQAMPEIYKNDDAVTAYRNYYINDKKHLHKWTNTEIPVWTKSV